MNWDQLPGTERRMIPLPAYKFHRDATSSKQASTKLVAEGQPPIEDWFYKLAWQEKPLLTSKTLGVTSTEPDWLLFSDEGDFANSVAVSIRERGGRATSVGRGKHFQRVDRFSFEIDFEEFDQVAQILDCLQTDSAAGLRVIYLPAVSACAERNALGKAIDLLTEITAITKALAVRDGLDARLWLVTRAAQRVLTENESGSLPGASLWGFGAVAALEQTSRWGSIVDLAPQGSENDAELLIKECIKSDREQRVAYRDARRYVSRFSADASPATGPHEFSGDALYLVTGAFGSIGLELAQWLINQGAKHLLLVGRTQPPSVVNEGSAAQRSAGRTIEQWREAGLDVTCAAVDVADRASMQELLANSAAKGHPVRGIFHAAVELVWKPLVEQTRTDFAASFHAKVRGALVLDELTRDTPLDFFVFFSSVAAALGAMGAASYAAANAFVDAMVEERRAQGRNFISVQWGYWTRNDARYDAVGDQLTRSGLRPMQPALALAALGRVMASGSTRAIVADIDQELLRTAMVLRGVDSFLGTPRPIAQVEQARETALTSKLRALNSVARFDEVKLWICREIRVLCGWPVRRLIDEDRGFFDMGMTSLTSLELRKSLEAAFGCKLPGTVTLLYPNVNSLADFMQQTVFGSTPKVEAQPVLHVSEKQSDFLDDEQTRSALIAELELLRGGR